MTHFLPQWDVVTSWSLCLFIGDILLIAFNYTETSLVCVFCVCTHQKIIDWYRDNCWKILYIFHLTFQQVRCWNHLSQYHKLIFLLFRAMHIVLTLIDPHHNAEQPIYTENHWTLLPFAIWHSYKLKTFIGTRCLTVAWEVRLIPVYHSARVNHNDLKLPVIVEKVKLILLLIVS